MKKAFHVVPLGPQVELPKDQFHKINSFAGGLELRDAPEDLQPGQASSMDDMRVSRDDRIERMPGVSQLEVLTHNPAQVLLHPGYRFSSALVFLAPPFIGVKANGATTWINVGLPNGTYGFTDYAGVLLLSCGVSGTFYKEPDKATVQLIPGAPAGLGLASFANRVVLGATTIGGKMDLMAIGWSDSSADYKGWSDADGAGAEVMIGSMRRADRFQAFAQIGYNMLGIVNRRSLWIAEKTGDVFEPMNIQPKLEDTGATHAATVLSTEYGAILLSDDGVRVFDSNSSVNISEPINQQLVPEAGIDEAQPYSASIDPRRRLYHLHAPAVTWTYDLNGKRWYRQPRTYLASVWFPEQGAPGPTWDQAVGTWDSQVLAWWQLDPQEFRGKMHYVRGGLLGIEDIAVETDFGVQMTPAWFDRKEQGDNQDLLFTSQTIYLTYETTSNATVELWLPNENGDFSAVVTAVLLAGSSRIAVPFIWTGRGVGLGIRYIAGSPRIRKASVRFQVTSEL